MQNRFIFFTEPRTNTFTTDLNQPLGKGVQGRVYKGVNNDTREIVAIKRIFAMDSVGIQKCMKEAQIMECLSQTYSINIIKYHGVARDQFTFSIAMEYASRSSLDVWLKDKTQSTMKDKQLFIMLGVASGLFYMHAEKILHCDIKPANIMLGRDLQPKIGDFGLSKRIGVEDLSRIAGTPYYFSPELLLTGFCSPLYGGLHSEASDMYSFGLLCWCILTQSASPNTKFKNPADLLYGVVRDGYRETIPAEPHCPNKLSNLIQLSWWHDPQFRPKAIKAVEVIEEVIREESGASHKLN